nr:hypothetical protein [uncultured Hyphomonas sp.]
MPQIIRDEIEVVSSKKAGRLAAAGIVAISLLFLCYTLLTPDMIEWLKAEGGFKTRLFFLPPFIIQKMLGAAFTLGFALQGILFWQNSADGRFIMAINREGIRTAEHLISWEAVREVHFYKNGYLFYLLDDTHYSIGATGSGVHRDIVLEVVKKVKPDHVRLEYFDGELPSVAPKLAPIAAMGALATLMNT